MNAGNKVAQLERAAVGCILGTAVGDALGLACEGLSRTRQRRLFPDTDRYHFLFGRGMCSDDTEHACLLAQSLIASAGGRDAESHANRFASDFAWRLRFWLLGLPAGVGWATLKSILKLWLFIPPRLSGVRSAGNGPAMRSALLGVCFGGEPERLRAFVRVATRITHTDPKAEYAALAVALAARLAATEGTVAPKRYREELAAWLDAGGGELLTLVERIEQYLAQGRSLDAYADSLGCAAGVTGYAYHTVPVALFAWLAHPGDYRAAVIAAIRCGGDTDTVAAVTGAIVGSGTGKAGIPDDWLAKLWEWPRTVQWMERLGERLARSCVDGYGEPPLAVSTVKLFLRNLFFLAVVLVHGFRRLLPPH
jgi:ADP-ribosylglycohydrolase